MVAVRSVSLAVVVILGLLLSLAIPAGADERDPAGPAASTGAALAATGDGADATTFRPQRDHRRDTLGTSRAVKQLLAVTILATFGFAPSRAASRRKRRAGASGLPSPPRSFRGGDRAPPAVQLSFA